jgi:5-methylcytosine-specific restriction endonuclease McrA
MIAMSKVYHFTQLPLFVFSKVCIKCGTEKPLDQFFKNSNYTDGRLHTCNICIGKQRRENVRHIPPPLTKICAACHIEKSISEFFKDKTSKTGYRWTCKDCLLDAQSTKLGCVRQKFIKGNNYGASDTKWCYGCEVEKPLSEFSKDKTKKDGYHTRCNDCHRASSRAYRDAHIEEERAKSRAKNAAINWPEYYVQHKLKMLAKHAVYRARKKAARIGKVSYKRILERDGYVCHICKGIIDPKDLHFDHVIPLSRGGSHSEENIKPAHKLCNIRKSNKLIS